MGNAWHLYAHPEVTPDYTIGPTFDTMYGFKNGRKERGSKICNFHLSIFINLKYCIIFSVFFFLY